MVQRIEEFVPFTVMEPRAAQLDKFLLDRAYESLNEVFPGLYSLLIVKNGQLIFEKYKHPAETTSYSIKSITKSIMNSLVGIALRDGLIESVDQLVSELVPEPLKSHENLKGVRIKHLLATRHSDPGTVGTVSRRTKLGW